MRLEAVAGFDEPSIALEQYLTPPTIAASLVHTADLRGDLERPVVDLGCGTGMLAIAAALAGATPVVGLDADANALERARDNAADLGVSVAVCGGDVHSLPLCPDTPVTVVMNPPFGARRDRRGADRPFLAAAADIAAVSYSIHNADSHDFVESYVDDLGGRVTDAYALEVDVPHQFDFHEDDVASIDAEAYRIVWR